MKKHNGMRPHDVVVLLKIVAKADQSWMMKDLAIELGISASEVSESLNRSAFSGLLSKDKKRVMKLSLLEFIEFGLKFVFPVQPSSIVRGIPTAHSAAPLNSKIQSDENYVWPFGKGTVRGQSIAPLYPLAIEAALRDPVLYELLALVDAMRVGKAREKELAVVALKSMIINGE